MMSYGLRVTSCGLGVAVRSCEFRVSFSLFTFLTRNPELATRNMNFKTQSVKQTDDLSVSEPKKVRYTA